MSAVGAPERPPLAADLRMVLRQAGYEQLAFWRNRLGAVFTIGFSVMFLVLLDLAAGKQRIHYLGNITLEQYYVPGFAAYGVMAACFNFLATLMVIRRETGLLKRLRLSPLPSWVLLSAIFVSTSAVAVVQVVVLLLIGRLGFGVHFPLHPGPFVVAIAVGDISFCALGAAMSTLVPNQEAAGPITSIVFFVFLFLSGLWFPLKPGSGLAEASAYFPFRHFIVATGTAFNQRGGTVWSGHDLLVVAIWGALAAVVALRRFRWAPHRT